MNAPQLFLDARLSHFTRKRDEVRLSARYCLIVRADPYSVCSAGGGPGRAHVVSRRGVLL